MGPVILVKIQYSSPCDNFPLLGEKVRFDSLGLGDVCAEVYC